MIKAREMIGLPVISRSSGKRLGMARDVLFSGSWELTGIVLHPGSWFSPARMIDCRHIEAFGADAIIVPGKETVRKMGKGGAFHSLLGEIHGFPVLTRQGNQLGKLEDIYIDHPSGCAICGIEVTEGFISDLLEGRKLLSPMDGAVIGEDAILMADNSSPV